MVTEEQRPQKVFKKKIFVKTFFGLEKVLSEELKSMGAQNVIIGKRVVECDSDKEILYKANYLCRTAIRVLLEAFDFKAASPDELYDAAIRLPWERYIDNRTTFAIDAVVNSRFFSHSKYAALRLKDAIVDRLRNKTGKRPSVDTENPMVRFNLHISGAICTVSLDSSGDSLHLRGYRQAQGKAPLSEVLAAGMIMLSGWKGENDFYDFMCGSGTLLTEAWLIAANIAPGKFRKSFGFSSWNDYDPQLLNRIKKEALEKERIPEIHLYGSDKSPLSVGIAQRNLEAVGAGEHATLEKKDFKAVIPAKQEGTLIINPPYGERLEVEDAEVLYKEIGDHLKQNFTGFDAWIISGIPAGIKSVGLRADHKIVLFNGPIECRYYGYKLFEGSLNDNE